MKTEARFYLEKRRDKKTGKMIIENTPILMFYSIKGKRLQYFTGIRIDAHKWDDAGMRVKKGYTEAADVNQELAKLKARVEEIYNTSVVLKENITIEELRERLKGNAAIPKVKKPFLDCFADYIAISEVTKSSSTVKNVKASINTIIRFAKEKGIRLEFNKITQDFYDALLEYCFRDKGYKNNHTGKIIKDLKAFLNWATDKGYNTNLDFRKKSFRKFADDLEILYLEFEELLKLNEYDFSKNPLLETARDLFCFGCFTGMRFSDIQALSPEQVHENAIAYRVVKTIQINNIPLNPYSKAILEKYKGKFEYRSLPSVQSTTINGRLKEVFKEVGINRKVQQVHFQGAKRIVTNGPFYDMVTFHISKKTFMTNFLAKGGSLLTAMAITGNKDFQTAKKYYKVIDSLKADEMARVFGK